MISVIIPCHNYGHLLAETIESLRAQSFSEWEAIVIDSASTDNTAEVAQKFVQSDSRVKYVFNSKGGISSSRNIGIKESKGEVLQFLDADDLLQPERFSSVIQQFQLHPAADAVYTGALYFSHPDSTTLFSTYKLTNETVHPFIVNEDFDRQKFIAAILEGNIFPINAVAMRKSAFGELLFDESVLQNEDWLYWCTAVIRGKKFFYFDAPEAKPLIRIHKTSVSQNELNMLAGGLMVCQRLRGMIDNPAHSKILERKVCGQRYVFLQRLLEMAEQNKMPDTNQQALIIKSLPMTLSSKILKYAQANNFVFLKYFLKAQMFKLRVKLKWM